MRVFSVDPGVRSGWALAEVSDQYPGGIVHLFGVVPKASGMAIRQTIERVHSVIGRPDAVAIEDQYVRQNIRSAMSLAKNAGRWLGLIEADCHWMGVPVEHIPPSKWQQAVLGVTSNRAASKRVALAVAHSCCGTQDQDEADAICQGLYWAKELYARERRSR